MKIKLTLCIFILHLTFMLSVFAQGTAFTYQGRLDDNGTPANGVYDLQFTIYDGPTSTNGNALSFTEADDVTISNGLFTARITAPTWVFGGPPRWLAVEVRTNGVGAFTMLEPWTEITPAPYAITASGVTGPIAAGQLTGTVASSNIANASITADLLAEGAVDISKLNTVESLIFLRAYPNPEPGPGESFGQSVAGVGTDKVLIGAYQDNTGAPSAGVAYLFSTTGALLTTFTNPTPANSDFFGYAVAGVGTDKVLIGAYWDNTGAPQTGAAYLFSTNGTLLTNFTNPTPGSADSFGYAVAAVGTDKVLIGASEDDTGATDSGAAYLFSLTGTLLITFTNPTPADFDYFGNAVAAVGADKVLIAAYGDDTGAASAGAAYLFGTNGALLTTFTNPTPVIFELFANAVAAMGTDKVLIGAEADSAGASSSGATYLFSTNGALLTTFTNPTPAAGEHFSSSVAAVGSDLVLIGAKWDNIGADASGAAYLYQMDGTHLWTLPNPTPAVSDGFGIAVAAVGSDKVLIGAALDDPGANDAGAAYLFGTGDTVAQLVAESVGVGGVSTLSLQDAAVTSAKLADGSVTTEKLAIGAVTTANLDTSIGVWTRSLGDVYRATGEVGIGTNNPAARLHVASSGAAPQLYLAQTSTDFVRLRMRSSTRPYWDIAAGGGNNVLNFFNEAPSANLMTLATNGTLTTAGPVNPPSDRNLKRDFKPVNSVQVLEQLVAMPMQSWAYKNSPEIRHMGPVAQDFYATFNLGLDEEHIATVDADGVALAAIQGLNAKMESGRRNTQARIAKLEAENAELKRILAELSAMVQAVHQQPNGGAP